MHFILLLFEYVSKFLEDEKVKKIIDIVLIITVLFLFIEVSNLKDRFIHNDEKIKHHQNSITNAFTKLNDLDKFIRVEQFNLLKAFIDAMLK